jgi:hypothetical protein
MGAEQIVQDRFPIDDNSFVDLVIWRLPQPVRGCDHSYKYRLAFIENDLCVVRFDNEAGKGDHMHIGRREFPFHFKSISELYDDFYKEVDKWRATR